MPRTNQQTLHTVIAIFQVDQMILNRVLLLLLLGASLLKIVKIKNILIYFLLPFLLPTPFMPSFFLFLLLLWHIYVYVCVCMQTDKYNLLSLFSAVLRAAMGYTTGDNWCSTGWPTRGVIPCSGHWQWKLVIFSRDEALWDFPFHVSISVSIVLLKCHGCSYLAISRRQQQISSSSDSHSLSASLFMVFYEPRVLGLYPWSWTPHNQLFSTFWPIVAFCKDLYL